MKFSENLYNLRKRNKMSQEKLAEKIGVSRQSVSKWENGTAYPEINRILELCKIFHCQLNDLVNDKILDFYSLDEDVKISICSKVLQIITMIISAVIVISMFFVPSIVNNINTNDGNIIVAGKSLQDFQIDEITSNTITNVLNEFSKGEIIFYTEIIIIGLVISVMIISFAMLYLSKLFKNISEGNTPFTLDNLKNIKIIAILFIVYLLFPDITGTLFQWITKINLNIDYDITKIFYVLIILCIYYIFDYGHQIQLDSKGKIYGEIDLNE